MQARACRRKQHKWEGALLSARLSDRQCCPVALRVAVGNYLPTFFRDARRMTSDPSPPVQKQVTYSADGPIFAEC